MVKENGDIDGVDADKLASMQAFKAVKPAIAAAEVYMDGIATVEEDDVTAESGYEGDEEVADAQDN
jgi:hypothetical protein